MMTKNIRSLLIKRTLLVAMIAAICFVLFPAQSVQSQSQTILAVQPEELEVPLGNQVVLELSVALGLNVNAFDLTVDYDPQVLSFEKWENGDYLESLAVVKEVDDPGSFRLAATQLAQPDVSGDGVLIKLTFNTEGAGESAIDLVDVAFADSQGGQVEPVTMDGEIFVTLSPTYTPTLTPTRTPTTKPTLTPTPGPDEGTAYPVKNEATVTPTFLPPGNSTEGAYVVSGSEQAISTAYPEGSAYPSSVIGQGETTVAYPESASGNSDREDASSAGGEEQAETSSEPSKESAEPATSALNVFLWVVLVLALLAMEAMVLIVIRRRKNKGKDLLL
jgi:hypothetical protein